MKRRWIIRSLFILPLVLCLAAWSTFRHDADTAWQIGYVGANSWVVSAFDRQIHLIWVADDSRFATKGWSFASDGEYPSGNYVYPVRGLLFDSFGGLYRSFSFGASYRQFLGFELNNTDTAKHLAIPFWFPALISAALLWFVWRKTRPTVKGRAFPVEVKTEVGQP